MNSKIVPKRNKKYMNFIRDQECCLTGMEGNDHHGIDPHHEDLPGHGTMGGKCCDSRCIPIAHLLHCKMEDAGSSRKEVFSKYGVDPEEVIESMKRRWINAGGKPFWEEYDGDMASDRI